MTSAILMPASLVQAVVPDVRKRETVGMVFSDTAIAHVAAAFNVSFEAACNRLKQLGHIPQTAFFERYILNSISSRL